MEQGKGRKLALTSWLVAAARRKNLERREWRFHQMNGALRQDLRRRLTARGFQQVEQQLDSLGKFVAAAFEEARAESPGPGTPH
jgi:hypothetical protein